MLGLGRGLLVLYWCRRWRLHWRWRLRLWHLPWLDDLLLLLLAIHICHSVHSDIPMRVEGDAYAIRRRSAMVTLPWTLIKAVNTSTTGGPGRNG